MPRRFSISVGFQTGLIMSGFRDYDRWRLMSPEDIEEERERKLRREEELIDRADYERDRSKEHRAAIRRNKTDNSAR
jgi:hypothetical protein